MLWISIIYLWENRKNIINFPLFFFSGYDVINAATNGYSVPAGAWVSVSQDCQATLSPLKFSLKIYTKYSKYLTNSILENA